MRFVMLNIYVYIVTPGYAFVFRKREIVYLAIQKLQKYKYIPQTIENKCAVPYQAEASSKHKHIYKLIYLFIYIDM